MYVKAQVPQRCLPTLPNYSCNVPARSCKRSARVTHFPTNILSLPILYLVFLVFFFCIVSLFVLGYSSSSHSILVLGQLQRSNCVAPSSLSLEPASWAQLPNPPKPPPPLSSSSISTLTSNPILTSSLFPPFSAAFRQHLNSPARLRLLDQPLTAFQIHTSTLRPRHTVSPEPTHCPTSPPPLQTHSFASPSLVIQKEIPRNRNRRSGRPKRARGQIVRERAAGDF